MRFFTGLHQPADARHFGAAFVSVNRLRGRKSGFIVSDWIMDSGAFTEISAHGRYRHAVADYAAEIRRWVGNGRLLACSAQDWMCEEPILKRAAIADGLLPRPAWFRDDDRNAFKKLDHRVPWSRPGQREEQVEAHQRRTIERYDALLAADLPVYVLPVLQGFTPAEYVDHVRMYGARLQIAQWVGVGSVCKRNGDPRAIAAVLLAIKGERPDLRLHGFGLKTTALSDGLVRSLLDTADSMAWSFAARKQGRNGNDWREAQAWTLRIAAAPAQAQLDFVPWSTTP